MPSRDVCAYLAGFFDGEGSIVIRKRGKDNYYPQIQLSLSNTDELSIKFLHESLGGRVLSIKPSNPKYKTQYSWRLTRNADSKTALELMLPWLIIKKERAEAALTILRNAPSRHHTILSSEARKEVEAAFLRFGTIGPKDRKGESHYVLERRICLLCGKSYITRRARKTLGCSKSCGMKMSWQGRKLQGMRATQR